MSTQSNRTKALRAPQNPSPLGERVGERPTERAFVVQFEPIKGARSHLRGRVELVSSGEAARFRSIKQLVGFMLGTRKRAPAGPPS